MEKRFDGWIGMMDSGVGGMSVLKRAADELPNENFVYFGDSVNAPYGEKDPEWICERTSKIVDKLIDEGVKAVVIACNTATSAAGDYVREQHPEIPIVGVEPALKPAVASSSNGGVLVMATPVTIKLHKYQELYNKWGRDSNVYSVLCEGLATRIEAGNLDADDMHELLERLIGSMRGNVDSVVLGCTHYPFIHKQICDILGDVSLFDGAYGTAKQLKHLLAEKGQLLDAPIGAGASATGAGTSMESADTNAEGALVGGTNPSASAAGANTNAEGANPSASAEDADTSMEDALADGANPSASARNASERKIKLYSSIDTPEEAALYNWFFTQDLESGNFDRCKSMSN